MKTLFLARCATFLATLLFSFEVRAGTFFFYADTARVTLSSGQTYLPGTGTPGSVQVRNSYGQLVSGTTTAGCTFFRQGSQVVGGITIDIPSPGTYSFSFPAQNGSGVRYHSAFYTLVSQGGSLVLSGGQSNSLHGEVFPYYSPPTYGSSSMLALPSGPLPALYSSGYIRVRAPLTRAGHSFTLEWRATAGGPTSSAMAYYTAFVTTGPVVNGNAAGQLESLMVAIPNSSVPATVYEWWLRDTTANQKCLERPGRPDANSSAIGYSWSQASASGVSYRYYAIPDSRRYDSLGQLEAGLWTPISAGYYSLGTYSNGTSGSPTPIGWFVGSATGSIGSATAYVGDATTGERTNAGAADVRSVYAWAVDPEYAFYPVCDTHVTLHSREAGHRFAVHSKVTGGPVWSRIFTAVPVSGNARLDFSVGKGLQFWVTREAENGSASQPVAPVNASSVNGSSWVATTSGATFSAISPNPNLFPAAPSRPSWALTSRPVRINANARPGPGRSFMLRFGDGYTTTYRSTPQSADPVTGLQVPAYTSGVVTEWNGASVPMPDQLPVYEFTAATDWRFSLTVRDQAPPLDEFAPSDISNRIDWLAPWVSPTLGAPPGPTITLQLPQSRIASDFARPDLADPMTALPYSILSPTGNPIALPDYVVPGLPGLIQPHHVPIRSIEFTNPTPDIPGSFPLIDLDLDDPTPITISAGTNDLRTWFAPPVPVEGLQISTSRWDHVLRLCHPTGESYPVTRIATQAAVSVGPGGTVYQHPYHYFTATSVARPDLPWYVEDLSTDPAQRIGPTGNNLAPTNDELIAWYDLPAPKGLTGVLSTGLRRTDLVWSPDGASHDGAFQIERQLIGNGTTVSTITTTLPYLSYLAQQPSNDGLIHFSDPMADETVGQTRSFRVRFRYGTPAEYSAWSNVAAITGWEDADGDGMPDAWELANFGTTGPGAGGNEDGDTIPDANGNETPYTNLQEFLNHTNPNALSANAPGSTLIVYTPLQ